MVFALDSVITAVGMARQLWVMVTAIVLAMLVMLVSAAPVSHFINRHPTLKMLAAQFPLAHRGDVGGGRVRQTH
jgi:predicted tellurium resistance membrane protein TerC